MLRDRIIAGLLLTVAIVAAFGLVVFKTNIVTTYRDYSRKQSIAAAPLLVLDASVSDLGCFPTRPCKIIAIAREPGVYSRDGVPRGLALWGGIVVPVLLLGAAIILFIRSLTNRMRGVFLLAAVPLFVCGGLLLVPLSLTIDVSIRQGSLLNLKTNEVPLLFWSIPGLALVATGIWCSTRALHGRA